MTLPPNILVKAIEFLHKTNKTAIAGGKILRKVDITKMDDFVVKVIRRDVLGKDGGISQVIRIMQNKKTKEAWHIVIKAGKIIHRHLLR